MSFLEKFQPLLNRFKSTSARPPLEKYYVFFLAVLSGYMVADLGLMYVRPTMLPKDAPPIKPLREYRAPMKNLAEYSVITDRNIFNEDGVIPPALGASEDGQDNTNRPAVLSQLPLQLLGTIVHFNPKLSIATVSITSKNISMSYKVDEEIEGLARVTKIERKKLTFINLNNRMPEYIEIPEEAILNFGLQVTAQPTGNSVVDQRGRYDFAIRRTDLDNLTSNLSSLLQQARMEPVFSPDGISIEGFRFVNIQPGSIYEKLGFKIGDMIESVNGEPVNSASKAMEMYNVLKTSNAVQLGVERDGRSERFNYTIQ
jgi:general secretion pathway protein C